MIINMALIEPTIHLGPKGRFVKSRILPPDAVRVDRTSRWGNVYVIGQPMNVRAHGQMVIANRATREQVLTGFQWWLEWRLKTPGGDTFLEPLVGRTLACWCKPPEGFNGQLLCHGQIIAGAILGVPPESIE